MSIDKQKLQKLLWAEAASYRADCADWKRNTEALQEFLGEKTVEEVALELLAENVALRSDIETWRLSITAERNSHKTEKEGLQQELDRLKGQAFAEELAALRKDAERYRWLQHGHSGYIEVVEWIGPHATGMTGDDLDALVDTAMSKAVQP
ncbi:hypothetical protein PS876_04047 [Pseudomonas fluorescens]|uniref:hypothetical protein n=1 Tax=Pseudomonas fluorescens TaxID=294 RepID=UPI00123EFEFC|nr:hypothetical protein [Pseudomonas fluorescens]VVP25277.1 hypothetical protein PS876_04047 [Pseudomonas fluorescens]